MRDVEAVVRSILKDRNLGPCVTHHQVLEAEPARYAGYPAVTRREPDKMSSAP